MALFIRQNENRSQLQEKLAAELQDRAKQRAVKEDYPDGVNDAAFLKDTKQTTSLAWVWILVLLAVIAIAIWLTVVNATV